MNLLSIQDMASLTVAGLALVVIALWIHYHKPPSGKW